MITAPGDPVAVTGLGLVTPHGRGVDRCWRALTTGEPAITRISRFPADHLISAMAGVLDHLDDTCATCQDRSRAAATLALSEAIEQSGLGVPCGAQLVMATSPFDHEWPQRLARLNARPGATDVLVPVENAGRELLETVSTSHYVSQLAHRFGISGMPVQLHTACASGSSAVQIGCELIRAGTASAVVVGGVDTSVTPESITKFALLGALSTRNEDPRTASRPFCRSRDGFVMAEGAAAMVLERTAAAQRRGAHILGCVLGCGESVDAYHRTRSDPAAQAISAAMIRALADANTAPGEIGYVNAHGTSTPDNDISEATGLHHVFGGSVPPVSSIKSMIGHALSASGLIEAVATVLTLRDGVMAPTINHHDPDPDIHLDVVPNRARATGAQVALSNSFGFGGQNVSLVLGKAPA